MAPITREQHFQRIQNLREAQRDVKTYSHKYRVKNYMQGQVIYNLGDYPSRFSIAPTEYDYNLLKSYAESGIKLIQIHEDWCDAIRFLGADKYSCHDPEGLQKFVDLCHEVGLKIIPYVSSGYFHEQDPDFTEDFTRSDTRCEYIHFNYRECYPGSAHWREYIIPRTFAVMEKYGFDGIYNDMGYDGLSIREREVMAEGREICPEDIPYDPELEDLLMTLKNGVHERGGIYKVHFSRNFQPPCKEQVYDYLWIGENVGDIAKSAYTRGYAPYVVPCPDYKFLPKDNPEFFYAMTIPFMQFPLLPHGRAKMGRNLGVPGVKYCDRESDILREHSENIANYVAEHPDGPPIYSEWSPIPGDPGEFDRYREYLGLYLPMTEEGSQVWVQIQDTELLLDPIPEELIVSLFVNENQYLVLSNLRKETCHIRLRDEWTDRRSGISGSQFDVEPGKMRFLIKAKGRVTE